jgi:hypothetical protein
MVTGHLYDKEAKKQLDAKGVQRQLNEELNCVGASCYKLSFIIITAATLIGAFVSLILVARTIQFYKGDIYKRYRSEPVEVEGDTAEMKVVQNGGEKVQDEAKAAEK